MFLLDFLQFKLMPWRFQKIWRVRSQISWFIRGCCIMCCFLYCCFPSGDCHARPSIPFRLSLLYYIVHIYIYLYLISNILYTMLYTYIYIHIYMLYYIQYRNPKQWQCAAAIYTVEIDILMDFNHLFCVTHHLGNKQAREGSTSNLPGILLWFGWLIDLPEQWLSSIGVFSGIGFCYFPQFHADVCVANCCLA